MKRESGQMLLIGVLIVMILLITIPAMIFINNLSTRSSIAAIKTQKANAVTQEGLSYAMHTLASSSTTWNQALNGVIPTEFSNTTYTGSAGGVYSVYVSTGGGVETYQVQTWVRAGSVNPGTGHTVYNKMLRTTLSSKTLAATLPNEVRAPVALQLMTSPANTAGLVVHWGPIALFDGSNTWSLSNPMDASQFPRKFSQGKIAGTTGGPAFPRDAGAPPQDSDGKEYWANSSLGFPNVINTDIYISTAMSTVLPVLPDLVGGVGTISRAGCAITVPNCANLTVVGGTAWFHNKYIYAVSTGAIYIHGNAQFDDVYIDLKHIGGVYKDVNAAFIVDGNLTLNTPGNPSGMKLNVRLPPTAHYEYPYYPSTAYPTSTSSWPCNPSNSSCTPDGNGNVCSGPLGNTGTGLGLNDTNGLGTGGGNGLIQFRGFLYVKGNLIDTTSPGWLLDGAVRIDGTLNAPLLAGKPSLTILYDDQINHSISVTPEELMIDSEQYQSP